MRKSLISLGVLVGLAITPVVAQTRQQDGEALQELLTRQLQIMEHAAVSYGLSLVVPDDIQMEVVGDRIRLLIPALDLEGTNWTFSLPAMPVTATAIDGDSYRIAYELPLSPKLVDDKDQPLARVSFDRFTGAGIWRRGEVIMRQERAAIEGVRVTAPNAPTLVLGEVAYDQRTDPATGLTGKLTVRDIQALNPGGAAMLRVGGITMDLVYGGAIGRYVAALFDTVAQLDWASDEPRRVARASIDQIAAAYAHLSEMRMRLALTDLAVLPASGLPATTLGSVGMALTLERDGANRRVTLGLDAERLQSPATDGLLPPNLTPSRLDIAIGGAIAEQVLNGWMEALINDTRRQITRLPETVKPEVPLFDRAFEAALTTVFADIGQRLTGSSAPRLSIERLILAAPLGGIEGKGAAVIAPAPSGPPTVTGSADLAIRGLDAMIAAAGQAPQTPITSGLSVSLLALKAFAKPVPEGHAIEVLMNDQGQVLVNGQMMGSTRR